SRNGWPCLIPRSTFGWRSFPILVGCGQNGRNPPSLARALSTRRNPPMALTRTLRISFVAASLACTALLAACSGESNAQPAGGMPPPEVGVVTVKPGEVGLLTELP